MSSELHKIYLGRRIARDCTCGQNDVTIFERKPLPLGMGRLRETRPRSMWHQLLDAQDEIRGIGQNLDWPHDCAKLGHVFEDGVCAGCKQKECDGSDDAEAHHWETKMDSQFDNNLSEEVVCTECGVYGSRNLTTGEVYWPAT